MQQNRSSSPFDAAENDGPRADPGYHLSAAERVEFEAAIGFQGKASTNPGRFCTLGLLGTLGAVPALDAAVALVNQGVTHRFGATQLRGMELRDGVPKSLRKLSWSCPCC